VQVLHVSVVAVSLKGRIEAASASPAAPKPSAPRLERRQPGARQFDETTSAEFHRRNLARLIGGG
jgi:hypothetical protein